MLAKENLLNYSYDEDKFVIRPIKTTTKKLEKKYSTKN